ncbi:MAG: dockerin type I repeat-containing protein [Ruminococcus sp.]|nr:dockerin type I repeat-containing protein [Ruminococcus sp.]
MMKKLISAALSAAVAASSMPLVTSDAADPSSRDVDALQYTYEIYPLAAPFNEYFYVRTENPNPESFRFSDKDSPYSETSVIYNDDGNYADVEYEDAAMHRVKGGYIFKSFTTNGGEVTLQVHEDITRQEFNTAIYGTPDPETTGYSPYHGMPVGSYDKHYDNSWSYTIVGYYKWVDTDVKITLPELYDDCDYLIKTYAKGDGFFDKMDAVQSGFSSICLYSGSYIRGELYRSGTSDWRLTPAFYADQPYYIYSPYSRKDSKSLLASALYPFRYDSLGFPGMMGKVSKRLSEDSTYEWSSTSHAHINVTYDGETKTYGGNGHGDGQGLTEDKLTHIFTFGDKDESLTVEQSKALLDAYARTEMDDDIPREGELTWKWIYDTVGDGAWVDCGSGTYTYLYQKDDKASFRAEEWGVGNNLYWSGSLGYCADTWVDGKYVSKFKRFVPGATLEEHPESSVMLTEAQIPVLSDTKKEWDKEKKTYVFTEATAGAETRKNVLYRYDKENNVWKASVSWDDYYIKNDTFRDLAERGIIDSSYYDMLILTPEKVEALIGSAAGSEAPDKGFVFDGVVPNGSAFLRGDVNDDGEVSVADAVSLQKWILGSGEVKCWWNADLIPDRELNAFDMIKMRRLLVEKLPSFAEEA